MLPSKKMLFLSIISAIIIGSLCWNFFIENYKISDIEIPQSQNIRYNKSVEFIDVSSFEKEFENHVNKPILIYLYTTWCQVCNQNFTVINEIAREFQNTDLKVFAIAIDRKISKESFDNYLSEINDIYFIPRALSNRQGFFDFLESKKIFYNDSIPFTALIGNDNKIICQFSGTKSANYLRNKIIRNLYPQN